LEFYIKEFSCLWVFNQMEKMKEEESLVT